MSLKPPQSRGEICLLTTRRSIALALTSISLNGINFPPTLPANTDEKHMSHSGTLLCNSGGLSLTSSRQHRYYESSWCPGWAIECCPTRAVRRSHKTDIQMELFFSGQQGPTCTDEMWLTTLDSLRLLILLEMQITGRANGDHIESNNVRPKPGREFRSGLATETILL